MYCHITCSLFCKIFRTIFKHDWFAFVFYRLQYMDIDCNTGIQIAIHGYRLQYMDIDCNTWIQIAIYGYRLQYMDIDCNTWIQIAIHGYRLQYMDTDSTSIYFLLYLYLSFSRRGLQVSPGCHRVYDTKKLMTPDVEELRRIAKTLSPLSCL